MENRDRAIAEVAKILNMTPEDVNAYLRRWDEYRAGPKIVPIDEILTRGNHWHRHKPQVIERIRRLNAGGVRMGDVIRGYHPHARSESPYGDFCGVKRFNAKWGKGAHRKLPRKHYERDGKRIRISGIVYMQGPMDGK